MSGPALRSYTLLSNVKKPYSRTLHAIKDEAEQAGDEAGGDEDQNDDATSSSSSSDEDEDEDEEEEASDDDQPQPCDTAVEPQSAQADLAQIQKRQAWLRGGGPDTSDSASVRSAAKKKANRPGVLETLLLPMTMGARAPALRSNAAVRPHARRRSTTDVRKTKVEDKAETASIKSPSVKSSSSKKTTPKQPARPFSLFLAPSAPVPPPKKVECITCLDDVPIHRSARLECTHRMCFSCLKRIFTLSTTDPQLMPPKCCTDKLIPLRHVDRIFDTEFKKLWNRKFAEYNTKNRLYCPSKGCGEWIKPKYIETDRATGRKKGTCSKCKTKVCKKCGVRWHGNRSCDNDAATKSVIDMGRENGWQRCYSCRTMVQLAEGCNHMRCRCNAEFCMVCGDKWKTCDCPWFNLPPEIAGVEEFLIPGQNLPPPPQPPLDNIWENWGPWGARRPRRGNEMPPPPPPPGFMDDLPPPPPMMAPPPGFRDRRDMPLDPLNVPDVFRPPEIPRSRQRRRRTIPAELDDRSNRVVVVEPPLSPQEQEAADEQLARILQEQELEDTPRDSVSLVKTYDMREDEDSVLNARRRANRRARRTGYANTITAEEGGWEVTEVVD